MGILRKIITTPPKTLFKVLAFRALRSFKRRTFMLRSFCRTSQGSPRFQKQVGEDRFRRDLKFFVLCDGIVEHRRSQYQLLFPGGETKILEKARNVLDHRFDLLGSGPVELGKEIDWSRDFKSGHSWPNIHYTRIREVKLDDSSDIKVPWELSRFYHFSDLGRAYHLTSDEQYTLEFKTQIKDWISKNPPFRGVNWNCPMEVAIRAVNWVWGLNFFRGSPLLGSRFHDLITNLLYLHGDFIFNNLEFDKKLMGGKYIRLNGNHYVANLVGLIYLGIFLDGQKPSKWLEFARRELFLEISNEIFPDGVHWELSPSYHRLVLEMILSALILLRDNGNAIPLDIEKKVLGMLNFVYEYTKPDGSVPMVRDSDNGRLHMLSETYFNDHRHVLAVGGVFFEDYHLLAATEELPEDVFWLLGKEGCKRWLDRKSSAITADVSDWSLGSFPDAGYYILKRKRPGDDFYLFISCANVGMNGGYGGHAHCDALSFELYWGSGTIISDSGTYVYSADPVMRNAFRSTSAHNTLRVDGLEINRFDQGHLFNMENDASPQILECFHDADIFRLKACHYGYSRLPSPVVHTRTFLLDKARNTLTLKDELSGKGIHQVEAFLHFFPGVRVERMGSREYCISAEDYAIRLRIEEAAGLECSFEKGWWSPSYGVKEENITLVLKGRKSLDLSLRMVLSMEESGLPCKGQY